MASIPKTVSDRLTKEIRRFRKILQNAKNRDVNEADTVTIVTDILSKVFGFDKYAEITSEHGIRGTYCDLAVQLDGNIKYLIEVKAIGLNLNENHLRQTVNYAAQKGVQWAVLTNGVDWEIYRIKFERPVDYELLCKCNLIEMNPKLSDSQDKLFILCKEGLSKDAIAAFHAHVSIVNKFIVGAILQSDSILPVIRRELRKMAPGLRVDVQEIEKILVNDVLKRDVVEGDQAKEAKSRLGKAIRKSLKKS